MGTEKMVVVVEVETVSEPTHMSAKEARAIAEQKHKTDGHAIFNSIINEIPEYAKKGDVEHSFRIDGTFSGFAEQTAVVLLEQLGYRIKVNHYSNPTIRWYEVKW